MAQALQTLTYRDDASALAGCYVRSGSLPALDNSQGFQIRMIMPGTCLSSIPGFRDLQYGIANATAPLGIMKVSDSDGGTNYSHRLYQPNGGSGYYPLTQFLKTLIDDLEDYSVIIRQTSSQTWFKIHELGTTTPVINFGPFTSYLTPPAQTNNFFTYNERLTSNSNLRAGGPFDIVEIWDQAYAISDTEASAFNDDPSGDANVLHAWDMAVAGSDPGTITAYKGGVDLTVFEVLGVDFTNPAGSYEYSSGALALPFAGAGEHLRQFAIPLGGLGEYEGSGALALAYPGAGEHGLETAFALAGAGEYEGVANPSGLLPPWASVVHVVQA